MKAIITRGGLMAIADLSIDRISQIVYEEINRENYIPQKKEQFKPTIRLGKPRTKKQKRKNRAKKRSQRANRNK